MKNLLQKALAGWLSVILLCGSSVPALASDGDSIDSGSVHGKVFSFEGPIPSDVIELDMPTRREGMFDFIIDPGGAIAESNAAKYKSRYGKDVTFDEGRLFFQNYSENADGSRHISFSSRSDSLIVTNLSNVPVDVSMNLEVNKGGYNFDFASTPDFKDANGNVIDNASMYMALVTDQRETPVGPVDVTEDGQTSTHYMASAHSWLAPPDDGYELAWSGSQYVNRLKESLSEDAFHSMSFHVTGAIGEGGWDDVGDEITMNVVWDVVAYASEYESNPYQTPDTSPSITSHTCAYAENGLIKVVVNFGSGPDAMPNLMGIAYTMEDGTSGFVGAENLTVTQLDLYESLVSVSATGPLLSAESWAIRLSNDGGETLDLPVTLVRILPEEIASAFVSTQASNENKTAEIEVSWGNMTSVKEITYQTTGTKVYTISGSSISVEEDVIRVTFTATTLKGKNFTLVLTNEENEVKEIPLELVEHNVEASATVAEPATLPGESALINVDWGSGRLAMTTVSAITYVDENDASATIPASNITISGATISVKFTATTLTGKNFVLILRNSDGATIDIPLELVDEPATDPTLEVTTQAKNVGDVAIIAVNWGGGRKKMTSVSKLTYTDASGKSATISSSYITADAESVSVKFTSASITGTNFVLTLKNDKGATFEAPLDLVVEPDIDPTAESSVKATAAGESSTVNVNWGSGDKKMSSVSKVTYTNRSGSEAVIASSNITTSGNVVTIKFDATSIRGRRFVMTFANEQGATFDLPIDLLNVPNVNPTANVTSMATAVGERATITVDWGSGDTEMTSVSQVKYTSVYGYAESISGDAITTQGNSVSVLFDTSDSILGEQFILVLSNEANETYEIPVELLNVPEVEPVLEVTTQAQAAGDVATISVNWGSGRQAMTALSKITYTTPQGNAATIGNSYITVSDNLISVKFTSGYIKGRNFVVVLKNNFGKTYEARLDLANEPDANPQVSVKTKAGAAGETAILNVDWGGGSKFMTSVSKVTYTNAFGATATISSNNIAFDDESISITVDKNSIFGSNFVLELTNYSGATFETPIALLAERTASASVTQKAGEAGETASITVDWGVGAKAMTSVSKLTYTNSAGASASISAQNLTVSDNVISVRLDEASSKGYNFKLTLVNNSGENWETSVALLEERSPTVTVNSQSTGVGQSASITVDWGVGTNAMTSVSKVTYQKYNAFGEISGNQITTNGNAVSVNMDSASVRGWNFTLVLTNERGMTFEAPVDLLNVPSVAPSVTVTNQATAAGQSATMTVNWGSGVEGMDSVQGLTYTNMFGESKPISDDSITVNGNNVSVAIDENSVNGLVFNLVLVNVNGETYRTELDLVDVPETDPEVTVISQASKSGDLATLHVDWGSGSKMMTSVVKVTYKTPSNGVGTISSSSYLKKVDENTVTVKFTTTTIKGTDFVLVLKNAIGDMFEAPVDLIQLPDRDPTATVTTKATAAGKYASITVDWGMGEKAMTSVSKVTYTNAAGNAGTIASSNITTSGTTISVKFDTTSIQGRDFVLTLENDSGGTYAIPLDLVNVPAVDPTVTVSSPAKSVNGSATIKVNWGSGSKAMSSVSGITYTNASGGTGTIPSGSIITSGTTITVNFDATSIQGTDFILTLTNTRGETFRSSPLVLSTWHDGLEASALVTQKASGAGQVATVVVDWGSGSKEMTAVSKITYKAANGGSQTIGTSYIKRSGDTLSITITSAYAKGSDFVLILKNASGDTQSIPIDILE